MPQPPGIMKGESSCGIRTDDSRHGLERLQLRLPNHVNVVHRENDARRQNRSATRKHNDARQFRANQDRASHG